MNAIFRVFFLFLVFLTISAISFGQFQPTPVKQSNNQITISGKNYYLHEVLKGQTLFGISKEYQVSEEEIKELNPDLKIKSVFPGMVLRIPDFGAAAKPSMGKEEIQFITHQASGKERAGQPCRVRPFPHENDNFQLAILLPLNISQNDTLSYSDTLKPEHFRFYEFLEGIYLAIDSMRLEGLNLTVEVFDTGKNPETIRGIIENDKLQEADLIIGPVFPNEIEIVAAFAKSKHIPMVSPLSTYDAVMNNPYAFQVRNKLPRQIELATTYLGSKYNQNVLVIGQLSEKGNPDFTRFLGNLGPQIKEHDPAKKATFKTIYFSEAERIFTNADSVTIQLDRYLPALAPNFIVLPSENEVFITEVINQLQQLSTTHTIHVFGLNQWVFGKLDLSNLFNVNLELYSDFEEYPFVDYTDSLVLNFCRKYKENWNIEPSWYSFHGFDIAWFFTRALFQFGCNLTASVPCWTEYLNHPSMLTPMRFQSDNNTNGFDNHAVTIIRYQKDELLRKKVN